ncbi:uroporphyrinogen decarboxylase [Actinomadura rupiterrae]|uniref:uroporphyrinogen decarboxylase n=1 Tax=Actinomadura rupiterrae TaxID=559627 RepID=UPI0020A332E5|nr:uroporphyrinogen decarboxylase [Actinomadura rupiterrae]MCP2341401.1 uroporphyrinogen decarboxylase [Actinomadura rupiterrae]
MDIGTRDDVTPQPVPGGVQPKRPEKLLLRALAGERTERPPVWLMRQAGRYLPEYHRVREAAGGMVGLCTTPEHAVEVTLQPIRRFPLDAAIVFADLPQVAAALGQTLDYLPGEGPVLAPPVRSSADIAEFLSVSRLHEELAPIYETVRQLARALPDETALVGYAGAPWTIATYMVEGRGGGATEHAVVKQWALSDPDGFQPLIDLLTTAIIQFLGRQIEAGAEAVQLFDTWAGVLPGPLFERWCVRPVAAIVAALKAQYPDVPVIAFPRGAGLGYDGFAEVTGAACIGLDATVPVEWAARKLQGELGRCVQGNLDPQLLVAGGPALHAETERILRALSGGPFVFNLGHGIVKTTPPEHVAALVEQVRGWTSPEPSGRSA